MFHGEVDDAGAIGDEERVGSRHERVGPLPGDLPEHALEVVGAPELVRLQPDA
jgi:hypothetical protein